MEPTPKRLNRRGLLTAAGGAAAVGAVGTGAALALQGEDEPEAEAAPTATVPFHGPHQAGIATPAQDRAVLLSLDIGEEVDRDRLAAVMRLLSDDAARLTRGVPALADADPDLAAEPARLTVTFGFGLGLLERIGLADAVPPGAVPLPEFSVDRLEEAWSGGDLLLQVCGDGDLTVSHAVRMLVKDSRSFASVRWIQRGFLQRPTDGGTPRNVLGQIDGTGNPDPEGSGFGSAIWIDEGPFAGGTTMVVRRMRTDLDQWDELDEVGKDRVIGRRISNGAPLTGENEHDTVDLDARQDDGLPVIPASAHVRRAAEAGETILRRPYNYDDGPDADGTTDTGLVFIAYQADVARFTAIQERLAEADLLNDYAVPIGSAVFAVPPGCEEGGWIGQTFLE
ncbi:Dyp-type peroxidase [Glycomyces salinus]|uniref:Dyp-type peroxidase n=1 Tax=Glycomyces salinus TaxID=980294 RepID=UPI0018EC1A57|nr:Dyp-type peroxidase [Glycomyces salinus]